MVSRPDGQRLERAEARAGGGAGAAGLAAAAHRGGRRASAARRRARTCRRRGSRAAAGRWGRRRPAGQNRPMQSRPTDPAPTAAAMAAAPGRSPAGERLRAVPRVDREAVARGRDAVAIWQDLVDDHGFAARYASVQALRARAAGRARDAQPRRASRDRDRAGRGGAGRLRRHGADGARPRDGEVPPHAALRADARLQPQVGAAARLALEQRGLGAPARDAPSAASAARPARWSSTT